jgi:hypothetical protein
MRGYSSHLVRLSIYLLALVLVGCASSPAIRRATSSYQVIVPSGSERYKENKDQKFLLGDRIGIASLPEYPQAAQANHIPVQIVCIEIDIDTDGRVFDSRPLYDVAGCPAKAESSSDLFLGSAQSAVKQWIFMPARMCTFPSGTETDDSCAGDNVTIEYVPVRLAFMFYFSVAEGQPHVTAHEVAENAH